MQETDSSFYLTNESERFQVITNLKADDLEVVPLLHLAELPLQGLVGAAQALDLDGPGLQLTPELVDLFTAGADRLVAAARLLVQVGELGAVPLLGGLEVFRGERLVLRADLLESGG